MSGLESTLISQQRSSEIPQEDDIYGWLIGSWELETFDYYLPDGKLRKGSGEVHFAWVLEGRAVQDTWIMPRTSERTNVSERATNRYGTTLRVYDPNIKAWRVTWINPTSSAEMRLIGRRVGDDIMQLGTYPDGRLIRWSFTEIKKDSFVWKGEVLQPDGKTWKLDAEFHARRMR
jgi:hypothetical protein